MNEVTAIAKWLYATLAEVEGSQGCYNGNIPEGAPEPLILFQYQGGTDQPSFFGPRLLEATYIVRATAATDSATALEGLANAIDQALDRAQGATLPDLGVNIVGVLREAPYELLEVVDGVEYRHLGGTYIIRAQGA